MDNEKIARELVKLAKEIVGGIRGLKWLPVGHEDIFGNRAMVAELEDSPDSWLYAYLTPGFDGNYSIYISKRWDKRLNVRRPSRQLIKSLKAKSALIERVKEATSLERAQSKAERVLKEWVRSDQVEEEDVEEMPLLLVKVVVTFDEIPKDVYIIADPSRWKSIMSDYSKLTELLGGTYFSARPSKPVTVRSSDININPDTLRDIQKFGAVRTNKRWFQQNAR